MPDSFPDHPVFGELEWMGEHDWWEGWIRLPLFAPYDCSATEERDEDEDEELFELRIDRIENGGDPRPATCQERAYSYLLDNQAGVHSVVIGALYAHYQTHADWWREDFDEEDADELVPRISSPDGLRPVIALNQVAIHAASRDGFAPVEFSFQTAWDDEHRLVVVIHKDAVVGVGGDGTGYYDAEDWREPDE